MYPAYVLILVLGLRRGEVLGLRWKDIDLDKSELNIAWQIQRIRRQLLHREAKTESSDAVLPLVDICATALRERQKDHGLVAVLRCCTRSKKAGSMIGTGL
jgi:integrase